MLADCQLWCSALLFIYYLFIYYFILFIYILFIIAFSLYNLKQVIPHRQCLLYSNPLHMQNLCFLLVWCHFITLLRICLSSISEPHISLAVSCWTLVFFYFNFWRQPKLDRLRAIHLFLDSQNFSALLKTVTLVPHICHQFLQCSSFSCDFFNKYQYPEN